jgi:hypothetical protein
MISTIVYSNKNFPISSERIFEKILNLKEKLSGQSIKIKSVFNKSDKDPSMIIFYSDENIYRFKDFSSGLYGDAADIVQHLYDIPNRQDAFRKILELFKDDASIELNTFESVKTTKEITSYKIRKWSNLDAIYWKSYYVTGKFLGTYNIKPLEEYVLTIKRNHEVSSMVFNPTMCYGYFNNAGDLCKIYNPNNSKAKFLKVKEFIQGEEQLKYNAKCLIISSSIKDIGAFKSMNFSNIELIAPDSENVKVPIDRINYYKTMYQYIFTMFDNDIPGMKAMKEYKQLYDIPYIYFTIEKDIADCIKEHGPDNTKLFFTPILKDAIKRKNMQASRQQ